MKKPLGDHTAAVGPVCAIHPGGAEEPGRRKDNEQQEAPGAKAVRPRSAADPSPPPSHGIFFTKY